MRIYISGPWAKRSELGLFGALLNARGHTVTSEWLWDPFPETQDPWKAATGDLSDLFRADMFVAVTEPTPTPHSSGGRHFEAGFAYGLHEEGALTYLVRIGPAENIFYTLPVWRPYCTFMDFLGALRSYTEPSALGQAPDGGSAYGRVAD